MADQNDFFAALDRLQKGVAQYKIGASLQEANSLVSEINAQQADETTKRAQIQQVAQGLAQQMLAAGAGPEQASAGAQTVDPMYGSYAALGKIGAQMQLATQLAERKADLQVQTEGRKQQIKAGDPQRYIPGQGYAANVAAGNKFREMLQEIEPAQQGLNRLKQFSRGDKLDWNAYPEASTIAQSLQGQLRIALTGPGAMSDSDRALLERVIANPTDFFTVNAPKRIETLQRILNQKVEAARSSVIVRPDDGGGQGGKAPTGASGKPDLSKYIR